MPIYVIEDDMHAEEQGTFEHREMAFAELEHRASVPWGQQPNSAPCASSATCSREYVVVEYDDQMSPWHELSRVLVLTVSAAGVVWHDDRSIS